MGGPSCVPLLLDALKAPPARFNVRRSAAIALGRLGEGLHGADRGVLAQELSTAIQGVQDQALGPQVDGRSGFV